MKGRLARGECLHGAFLSTGYAVNTELMGMAGFDYLIIDLEHGMGSERDILGQLHALGRSGTAPLVRVESLEKQRVHRLLDLGVQGIMFPRVETAEEARGCVAAMRYPPEGVRGVATVVRAAGYGPGYEAYREDSRRELLTIIQIETAAAVENVEEIAAVEGVDVLYIGPMDLSTSLGVFRDYEHPRYQAALARTLAAAARYERVAGILMASGAEARRYREMGFRFLTAGTDVMLLRLAAQQLAQQMRDA
ncbi:MAG: HpcH/HpaI aldolase family protein [Acidobacteriota bacterium]